MALTELFTDIADAIREKDGSEELIAPADFADRIRQIKGGGDDGPLDPFDVYAETRPTDWLPMPTPEDDEIYILFHIQDGASALIAFTVTCTGSYTVALGTIEDGVFVSSSSSSVASGSVYENELSASDFGNLTSTGHKQAMIKITGTDILTWVPSMHTKRSSPSNFAGWNIVEISCQLPNGTLVKCGNTTSAGALKWLQYFAWYGENNCTNASQMFANCICLRAILAFDLSKSTTMTSLFNHCINLIAIPNLDTSSMIIASSMFNECYLLPAVPLFNTSNATNLSSLFQSCRSLKKIPALNTLKVTSMSNIFSDCNLLETIPELNMIKVTSTSGMFTSCSNLTKLPALDTSKVTNFYNMFYGCSRLTEIPQLNLSGTTTFNNTFGNCYSLAKITFDPTIENWAGGAISLANAALDHAAIVGFFNSLPTITAAKAITLTGNPGVSELTDAEKAIATNKNWTLTL